MASIAFLEPYLRVSEVPMAETFRGELVSLLITSALKKIDQAKRAHDTARPVEKGFFLGRATAIIDAVLKAKPAVAKGTYLKKIAISTTMGPGIRVDPSSVQKAA